MQNSSGINYCPSSVSSIKLIFCLPGLEELFTSSEFIPLNTTQLLHYFFSYRVSQTCISLLQCPSQKGLIEIQCTELQFVILSSCIKCFNNFYFYCMHKVMFCSPFVISSYFFNQCCCLFSEREHCCWITASLWQLLCCCHWVRCRDPLRCSSSVALLQGWTLVSNTYRCRFLYSAQAQVSLGESGCKKKKRYLIMQFFMPIVLVSQDFIKGKQSLWWETSH